MKVHTWALKRVRAVQVVLEGVGRVAGRAGVLTGQHLSGRVGPEGAVVGQGVGRSSPHVATGPGCRVQPIIREPWETGEKLGEEGGGAEGLTTSLTFTISVDVF